MHRDAVDLVAVDIVSSLGQREGLHQYFLRYFVSRQTHTHTHGHTDAKYKPRHAKHGRGLIIVVLTSFRYGEIFS